LGNERLSETLRGVIADENNKLWLSPISIWETLILAEKQKIILNPDPLTWIQNSLQQLDTQEAPLTNDIALLSRQLSLEQQDPADRFIAATAIHLQLTLATVDQHFTKVDWLNTLS
jgi:PIN domain nuclease of toxin-antitoxin system